MPGCCCCAFPSDADVSAELVALTNLYRWQVERLFRCLKCIPGCRHIPSTTQNGVELQVCTATIASLLITLWVGCEPTKPTKRTCEMLCFDFQGWAGLEKLMAHIAKRKLKS